MEYAKVDVVVGIDGEEDDKVVFGPTKNICLRCNHKFCLTMEWMMYPIVTMEWIEVVYI